MLATLQWRKACERSLTLFVIASLLLSLLPLPAFAAAPSAVTLAISIPEQQTPAQDPEPPVVPAPVEPPQWPEVGERAQYAPNTANLAAPGTHSPAPVAESAQTPPVVATPVVPELALPAEPLEVLVVDRLHWLATRPDGMKYRFGGEEEPETGADQNSVLSGGVQGVVNSVWRWNLDRIEDPNGNVTSYGKHAGQNTPPHACVLFNRECHDLYVVFKAGLVYLHWLRFVPAAPLRSVQHSHEQALHRPVPRSGASRQ